MKTGIGALADKARKAWMALNCGAIARRGGVSYFNFAIHSEKIYDEGTYKALLAFAQEFHSLTGKKIAVCVSTPGCPLVSKDMAAGRIAIDLFSDRVAGLSKFADIGYHGHFYGLKGAELYQISEANYDKDIVISQIRKEIGWFRGIGISPKIYVAGWWFLTSDVVLELERSGISVDSSVRKGKLNTFGKSYLDDRQIPGYGEPFVLPPSGSIVEIQSLFGPVMPSFMMKYHISRYVDKDKTGDLFFIFPLHDWDITKYRSNIMFNVRALNGRHGGMEWMNMTDMRETYLKKNGKPDACTKR